MRPARRGRAGAVVVACATVLGLLTTACAAGPAQGRPADAVVIALSNEPDNLNPIFSYDVYSGNTLKIFDGLLSYGKDLAHVPELAAALPETSPDAKTYMVRLRTEPTFHDGVPVTAEDVVFTFTSILDPKVASPFRSQLDAVASVEALDPHTVRFTLNRVDPAFLDKLHLGIVPKHVLDGQDLNTTEFNVNPVGNGPFVVKEWRKGERLLLEANPTYYGGPPRTQRLVIIFVKDENARAAVMENGTADIAGVPPRLATRLRENDSLRVIEIPSADARLIPLPNRNPALADPRVRRALSLAVNRQQMVDAVLVGAGEPAYGPIVPGHWAYSPVDRVPYDPTRAGQLLDEAGWRDTDGDRVRDRDGIPLSFTVMYAPERSVRKDLALATRQNLAQVGVDVKLEGLGFEAIYPRLERDAGLFGQGTPYDPDLLDYQMFHSRFVADGEPDTNYANMANPRVDAALDAARSTLDRAQRAEDYHELQRALAEDGSFLYLVRLNHTVAISNRLAGIDPVYEAHVSYDLARGVLWNLQDWELTGARP